MGSTLISDQAISVVGVVGDHVASLGAAFGDNSPECTTAAVSWARAMGHVFRLMDADGGSINRDGDLSLYLVTGYGMHVGVVFFTAGEWREHRVTGTTARGCATHKRPPVTRDAEACDREGTGERFNGQCFFRELPTPGTWSLHS